MSNVMKCPMCETILPWEELKEDDKSTNIYVCPECPFVGFEYFDKNDTRRITERLK